MNARTKFIVYATLLLIGTFFFAARYHLDRTREVEEAHLNARIQTDVAMLSISALQNGTLQEIDQLERLVTGYVRHPLYLSVVIRDTRNYKLVEVQTADRTATANEKIIEQSLVSEDGTVQGHVTIHYNHDPVDTALSTTKRQLFLLFLLILNGIALPWVWFSSALDKTYRQVISTLKQVDEGDLKARIDLTSGGGLRDVASYFNQMLDSIEMSNNQLQIYVSKLAEKNMEMSREAVVRKNAERIALQNEKKFRAIFDQSVQLICMMTPSGTIIDMNSMLSEMLDSPKEASIDRPFWDLSVWRGPHDHKDWLKSAINQAQGGEICQKEISLLDHDEQEYFFDLALKPVLDENGEASMIIAEGRDVSARMHAEQALEDTEAQVRQSQKMEAIGRLAGGIAHDFNNLLTSILGFSNMVMDELDPNLHGDCRGDLQEVIFAAEKARGLTQKLLMLARKKVYHVEPIHLNEMLNQMEKIIQISLHEDIELVTSFDRDINYIEADSVSLEQIIINLAVNAKDAMPRSGRLYVTTKSVHLDDAFCEKYADSTPGDYVMLSVRDTGSGIPHEVIEHIFEPFYTTKEPGKGTGLGLATVYGLVKQFNGTITVDSKPRKGTEFTIYLPQISHTPTVLFDEDKVKEIPRGTETVLMVEDETAVRKLGERMIKSMGYTVLVATDGEHALEVYSENSESIDLVVTDVVMPRMTGPEVVKNLRPMNQNLKFLYVSGFTRDKLLTHGADEDDAPILQKPYSLEQLGTMIREVLDEENAQRPKILGST